VSLYFHLDDEYPPFWPQWREFRLEQDFRYLDHHEWEPLFGCRLCACTEESACPGGCSWVELDLCSRCVGLMAAWPLLRQCDGYGLAAARAFNTEGSADAIRMD
jgi:hypothetical protein